MARPRVKVPKTVAAGEVFEVKALLPHKMESGQRKDSKTGELVPRMIINRFSATLNGAEVFSSDWHPAISSNPYISFFLRVEESGELTLNWTDDNGETVSKTATISVG